MECSAARDGVIPRNYLHQLGLLRRGIYLITKVTSRLYSAKALYELLHPAEAARLGVL